MTQLRRVAIIGGNRIPFARSNGPYAHASNQDMLTAAIDGLVARFGLQGARVGEVAAGAVLKHSRDFNLTRECVLGSRLDPTTPAEGPPVFLPPPPVSALVRPAQIQPPTVTPASAATTSTSTASYPSAANRRSPASIRR